METPLPKFVSALDEKVSYDKEFEVTEIDEDDNDYESNLYKIGIFGNFHHIAMGKKKIHSLNDKLVYFISYLVYNERVVTKIGIFEKLYDSVDDVQRVETNDVDFENEKFMIHPKYYKMVNYLDEFSVVDVEEVENEKNVEEKNEEEETEEDISEEKAEELQEEEEENDVNANVVENENMDAKAIKISGTQIVLKKQEDEKKYEVIKTLSKSGKSVFKIGDKELDGKNALKNFINLLKVFMKTYIPNMKSSEIAKRYSSAFSKMKTIFLKKNEKTKKSALYMHELINASVDNPDLRYVVNIFVLALLEYICNVKFLVMKDGQINNFSIFEDDFKSDYTFMNEIDSYVITNDVIKNYDPDCFYVVEKDEQGNYSFYESGGSPHLLMVDQNNEFYMKAKELYEIQNHEFIFETQLTKFKQHIDNLV